MKYRECFFCFKKYLFLPRRREGFTLLEVMVSLFLTGIFMVLLTQCMVQVVKWVAICAERTRYCQEIRILYEFLTADCAKLFLSHAKQEFIELHPSAEINGGFSILLLRWFSEAEPYFFTMGYGPSEIGAVQYSFHPEAGVISRQVGRIQKKLSELATGTSLTLSQGDVLLHRTLVRKVSHFELYPIDLLGQKQTHWKPGSSRGLEYSVTFRSSYPGPSQTFHARIPVLNREAEN